MRPSGKSGGGAVAAGESDGPEREELWGPGGPPRPQRPGAGEEGGDEEGRGAAGDERPRPGALCASRGVGGGGGGEGDRPVGGRPGGVGGQALQREGEVPRLLEPLVRRLLQAVPHRALETRRHRAAARGELRRIVVQDGVHRLDRRFAVEGAVAGEHLVEHRAQREEVGAGIGREAPHLLRRHVPIRADHHAGPRLGERPAPSPARCRCSRGGPSLAIPKSRILARPPPVTGTRFSGLRSRWTMPRSCAAARPARHPRRRSPPPRRGGSGPPASRARRVSPSSNSVTRRVSRRGCRRRAR